MRLSMKVLGIFLGMAVLGFVMPHMSGEYLSAAEDCGLWCGPGDGTCDPLPPFPGPRVVAACCGGHCNQYEGEDPHFLCYGQCSVSGVFCNCVQMGCHNFCQ
ncbi:MAG: hypothetical protein OEV49_03600 [candidate division Zixibacteria bacterium]|nr:hypothetical protein [candidate division Zixibacteria bacterium]MDH3937828.1 hypothetical protein [candidate division Zixibacteria bacterium]